MGALASQATVPFTKLQYAYKSPLPLSKIKCTKAGHENPKEPASGKRRERGVHPWSPTKVCKTQYAQIDKSDLPQKQTLVST